MTHVHPVVPERFSTLAPDPTADLAGMQRLLSRGALRPEHLLVATDGEDDVARVAMVSQPDGTVLAVAFDIRPGRTDAVELYGFLLEGVRQAARSAGTTTVHATVVDREEIFAQERREALSRAGWQPEGERLELGATPVRHPDGEGIVEIDPSRPEVVSVMSASMAASLDDYDRDQVAALGPEGAAAVYRDMMVGGRHAPVPWIAHRGPDRIDGVAAIQVYPQDWNLGYLGVAPHARRAGVGAALARAMLTATAAAGVSLATASVAVANAPIRSTLERAGFMVRSPRTDFVLRVDG